MQISVLDWLQVGASNELPESEELDALYDRFLIRRQVSQVSDVGLPAMLAAAADNSLAVCAYFFSAFRTLALKSLPGKSKDVSLQTYSSGGCTEQFINCFLASLCFAQTR